MHYGDDDFRQFSLYKLYYEGRSINKSENGAIPLIFKLGKIRNIRFIGSLILSTRCEFS